MKGRGSQRSCAVERTGSLNRLDIFKATFDVNKHIEPKHILKSWRDSPELFSDLPPIPANAMICARSTFVP